MINLQYSVAFISSRCALHRLRRSIRFPSIFGFLMIFCRKTQRTNAKSGRPKVAHWKVAMWKKFTGCLVSKWERTGRNWSNFAHTDTRGNLSCSIDIAGQFALYDWSTIPDVSVWCEAHVRHITNNSNITASTCLERLPWSRVPTPTVCDFVPWIVEAHLAHSNAWNC